MKKLLLIVGLVMFANILVYSQYSVEGRVLSNNGFGLPGATIRVNDAVGISDVDGSYSISNVPSGKANISVMFMGYETYRDEIEIGADVKLSIMLHETAFVVSEITVASIRAKKTDPVAYSQVLREDIQKNNFGQDLPYLLSMTPGLVVSSDAGMGVGYTGMRIRGTDITRINVTVNGIPMNDAESQSVYWVNMPDFASSVSQVQIQRGVGTSTNGASSFGGSVNVSTLDGPTEQSVVVDNGYGSFNTIRNSVQINSGLLKNNFAFNARLSNIASDGFIDRSESDLKSFYLSGGYYGETTTVRLITFSGNEKTKQAWYGVPKVKLQNKLEGMQKLVSDDGWSDEEARNLFSSKTRTFNRYLYDNQTDNYQQDHYQAHFSHNPTSNLLLNAALHYTRGKGYYESYEYRASFNKYNFPYDSIVVDTKTVKRTDLVAQKWLDNHFYGATASGIYQYANLHLIVGGAWNRYDGDHFGNVTWTAINAGLPVNYRWYFNQGSKKDLNYYTKITYEFLPGISVYGDMQNRHVSYDISGVHDDGKDLTRNMNFNFFNPKFGFNVALSPQSRTYASVAVANREPSRSNFRDADDIEPMPEKLVNYEIGVEWFAQKLGVQVNGYYMDYNDQLVLTGQINNVGDALMVNVDESFRAGIELSAQAVLSPKLTWSGNVVLSKNKIKNFIEYVDDWNTGVQKVTMLGTTDIAFSPDVTFASRFEAKPINNLLATINTRFVGNQYIDNTMNEERSLKQYLVNDIVLRYFLRPSKMPEFEFGVQIVNLLDEKYITNAWVYSYYLNDERSVLDGYFPQAGRHFMAQVVMRF